MLADPDSVLSLLRCPRTGGALKTEPDGGHVVSSTDGAWYSYPVVAGQPVLVDFENSILGFDHTISSSGASLIDRRNPSTVGNAIKRLLSPRQPATRRNVARFLREVTAKGHSRPLVLVVGGGTIGNGMDPLYDSPDVDVVAFDIYATKITHFIADAHQIPLAAETFDGVVVQAVLEHVLEPHRVVSEIWRVLRPGGFAYAETPFMQQVHEGAYDFTRFTESGHRYLFRWFERVESGALGGPGLQLMWSADYLMRGLFRSKVAGKIAKALVSWTQYLDRIIPPEYAVDGASGVYFLGTKGARPIGPDEIVRHYRGKQ